MSYRQLPLASLVVNKANDRHGELENETLAIAWLFNNHEQHMKTLAKYIVEKGKLYEPPLVWRDGQQFVVFDGNRRVTCLKVLAQPSRAPNGELQVFFQNLRSKWKGELPDHIQCQLEADRDQIDDILYRRHTGTQGGLARAPGTIG